MKTLLARRSVVKEKFTDAGDSRRTPSNSSHPGKVEGFRQTKSANDGGVDLILLKI
jgi:hypothetical protein